MTQWEAFNMLVSNGVKKFFNPMYGFVKLIAVDSKNKEAGFETEEHVRFVVSDKFKLYNNPFVKQCIFPTSQCEDFVTYLRNNHKYLLLKPNSPVCFRTNSPECYLKFGVLKKINPIKDPHSSDALIQVYGDVLQQVPLKSILTIQEAKELINNQNNVQSIQN